MIPPVTESTLIIILILVGIGCAFIGFLYGYARGYGEKHEHD